MDRLGLTMPFILGTAADAFSAGVSAPSLIMERAALGSRGGWGLGVGGWGARPAPEATAVGGHSPLVCL